MDAERTIEDARSVCKDLRTLFEDQSSRCGETLEEVQRLCEIERLVIDDPRCHDELQQVERYAQYLFSGDHRRWARGPMPGEVFLRELILDLLRSVDIRLKSLATMQRSLTARYESAVTRRNSWAKRARVSS
jgi:hypothetical protein